MKPVSFFRLMRWEWRRLVAERFGLALLVVWCALVGCATWLGYEQTRARHADISTAVSNDRTAWAQKRAKLVEIEAGRAQPAPYGDPRSPTNSIMGQSGARPVVAEPSPLAALAAGPGDLAPPVQRTGLLTKFHLPPVSIENPSNRLAGPLDLNFVVSALLPLFVLVLGFDVLARERDARTLALIGCQPASLGRIAAARLSLHALVLCGPLVAAASVAVLGSSPAPARALGELGVWLLLVGVYLVFWHSVIAWVNFRPWSSSTNALVLSGAWLASVLLLPSLIQTAANTFAPPPDRRAFILEVRTVETDLFKRADEIRDAYYATNPERRPTVALNEFDTYYVQNLWPRTLAADAALAPALAEVNRRRDEHAAWWRQLVSISPTLAFRSATEQLAGITPPQQGRLIAEASAFQGKLRDHFGAKLASMRPLTLADYDGKPEPPRIETRFRERAADAKPALLGLIFFAVAALALAARSRARST